MAEQQKTQENKGQSRPVVTSAAAEKDNFKYFVRIANTDLDGNKFIGNALKKIARLKVAKGKMQLIRIEK